MAHGIITADERLKQKGGVRALVFGPHGIGKTSLIYTLPVEKTVLLNAEAGELALRNWSGDSLKITNWEQIRDYITILGGVDPSAHPKESYSQEEYTKAAAKYGKDLFDKYDNIFIDSLTELSRLCLHWADKQTGSNNDGRAKYGILKKEVIQLAKRIQHTANKNVFLVGGLDLKYNEYKQPYWDPQIEGSQIGLELPGILDEVFSMVDMKTKTKTFKAIITNKSNPWKLPAKDRSGQLNMIEEAHLGKIIEKCKQGTRVPNFDTGFPADINEEMPSIHI